MAEFEELKITVKAPDDEATKKTVESLKTGFRDLTQGPHAEGMKSLSRGVSDLEGTIKSMVASVGSGDAFKAIGGFTSSFGKAGTIGIAIAGIAEIINATIQFATNQARGIAAIADLARRVRVHPAQILSEIEIARRAQPEISEQQMMSIIQHLHERMVEIGERRLPEARERLLKFTNDPEVRRLKMELINQMIVAPQAEQLNIVMEGARKIIDLYTSRGFPGTGRLEAEDWVRELTGTVELMRVVDKFVQVSEEDKLLMDKMVASSEAWLKLTSGIATDFESIVRLISVNIMNDPVFGAILRFVSAGARAERELLEEDVLGKKPAMPWWWSPYQDKPNIAGRSVAPGLTGFLRWLYRTYQIMREPAAQEGTAQHLMGGTFDKLSGETDELIAQFRRLNALLSGEEKPILRLPIHNQPQGGVTGESNPLTLAPGTTQPGGGASTEARQPLLRPWERGDPVRGTYTTKKGTFNYPILSAAATPLPPLPGDKLYSGVSAGRGVATYFGADPRWGIDPGDPFGSSALRVPERYQGISLSTGTSGELGTPGQSLGQFHYVTDPNTGLTHVMQQTDVGPGVRTQKLVDIGAARAIQLGYETRKQFEAQQGRVERGEVAPWEVRPAGFGTYGRPGFEGRDITAPMKKNVEPTTSTMNIRELGTGKLIDPRLVGGQRGTTPGGLDMEYGGGSGAFDVGGSYGRELPAATTPSLLQGQQRGPMAAPILMASEQDYKFEKPQMPPVYGLLDTSELDSGLAREHEVDASGDLNVNVQAPAGTEVKAEGDGMFKGNVALNRQLEF